MKNELTLWAFISKSETPLSKPLLLCTELDKEYKIKSHNLRNSDFTLVFILWEISICNIQPPITRSSPSRFLSSPFNPHKNLFRSINLLVEILSNEEDSSIDSSIGDGHCELLLVYQVFSCTWRPSYSLRASSSGRKKFSEKNFQKNFRRLKQPLLVKKKNVSLFIEN